MITVAIEEEDECIRVHIADTGRGMPREQLPHLFDRYWQGRRGDRRGIGMGLFICKHIVERHGGSISAVSAVGEGTTFTFTLRRKNRMAEPAKVVAGNET